jgi:hypothetical protein
MNAPSCWPRLIEITGNGRCRGHFEPSLGKSFCDLQTLVGEGSAVEHHQIESLRRVVACGRFDIGGWDAFRIGNLDAKFLLRSQHTFIAGLAPGLVIDPPARNIRQFEIGFCALRRGDLTRAR